MATRWGNNRNSDRLYFGGFQNHCRWWLKTRNLKNAYSLEENLWPTSQHIKKQKHYFANKGLSNQSYVFLVVMYGCESCTIKKTEHWRMVLLNCGVGEDSWESLGLQGDPTSQSWRKSVLNIHWKDWGWSWSSHTLATWCEVLTHLKRP